MEGVGWAHLTSYWVAPDEIGLLAMRVGAIFVRTTNRAIESPSAVGSGHALIDKKNFTIERADNT